jgi:hypothetical protein
MTPTGADFDLLVRKAMASTQDTTINEVAETFPSIFSLPAYCQVALNSINESLCRRVAEDQHRS